MKYNQLQEAIIKVPNSILQPVNSYISSYLYYKIKMYIQRMDILVSSNTSPEEKEKIKKDGLAVMGKLQQKYGAKNISAQSANNIADKSIVIPINTDKFFQELNFKGASEGLLAVLKDRIKFELFIATQRSFNGVAGSQESDDRYTIRVVVNVSKLNPRDWLTTANQIMSTAYHEMQHAVQSIALKNINPQDKQLEIKPDYNNSDEAYYTSGIEYTPQLGNLVDSVVDILEKDTIEGKLEQNKNTAIKNAIHASIQKNTNQRVFLISLYKNDQNAYKKAMKEIYTKVSPVYDEFSTNGIDYAHTELPAEELEVNVNVLSSIYKMLKNKEDKFDVKAYGPNMAKLAAVGITSEKYHWQLVFAKNGEKYQTTLSFGMADEEMNLNAQQTLNLAGMAAECAWWEADDVIDQMELLQTDLKEPTDENISEAIDLVVGDAEYYKLDTKRLGVNKFSMFNKVFIIERNDESKKVDIKTEDDSSYYYVSLKQFVNLFQTYIRYYTNEPEEVQRIVDKNPVYMEAINLLRNL